MPSVSFSTSFTRQANGDNMIVEPNKVMKAAHYLITGCSLKDALSDEEIEAVVLMLADVLLLTGTPRYNGDEDDGN